MRPLVASSLAAALLFAPVHASAEPRSLDLARLLSPRAPRRHALADPSGRVPVVVKLPPGADAASLGLLPLAPGLATRRVAPGDLASFAATHPGLGIAVAPPMHTLLDQAAKLTGSRAWRESSGDDGTGVVVGVVDTGIDAQHPDFLDEQGKTRIAWLLDMSLSPLGEAGGQDLADLEHAFGCDDPNQSSCRVLDAAHIDADAALEDAAVVRDRVGHGTHVASIAAGDGGSGPMASRKYVGVAPNATLVVARVTHGNSDEVADPDIVTGARFVFDRADAMHMPAVVNISLGGDFGPHDGTSAVEKGLAALVGPDHPGRAIVVAAGNSGTLYADSTGHRYGVHTEVRVPPESRVRVPMRSPRASAPDGLHGQVFVWITFRPGDDVSIGLDGPNGERWIDQVPRGDEAGYDTATMNAGVVNGVVDELTPLTPDTIGAVVAIDGTWPGDSELAITLEGHGTAEVWLQGGGDAAPGSTPGVLFENATKEGTINVPATSPDLIAVGCTLDRIAWLDALGKQRALGSFGGSDDPLADSTCYFSSAGPTATGVAKPEISAPGALVAAAMGRDAVPGKVGSIFDAPPGFCGENGGNCFAVDAEHALLSGTSMSAPMVAGAVALLFQRDPGLTQAEVTTLLQAGARHPRGDVPLDFQLGPGALDVPGMMAAYDARGKPSLAEADPSRSWMSLSASYARPDPSWPVVGTVELRADDGSLVSGFAPERLALRVENGLVKKPLAKVAAGLYRFEVAGRSGTGGQSMTVEVTFDGQVVGEGDPTMSGRRTLPIGVDTWTARGDAQASGGCAVGGARGGGAASGVAWGTAIALAAAARRRRAGRTAGTVRAHAKA